MRYFCMNQRIPLSGKRASAVPSALSWRGLPLHSACGMIAATDMKAAPNAARSQGRN
jgi:hypothetical protein